MPGRTSLEMSLRAAGGGFVPSGWRWGHFGAAVSGAEAADFHPRPAQKELGKQTGLNWGLKFSLFTEQRHVSFAIILLYCNAANSGGRFEAFKDKMDPEPGCSAPRADFWGVLFKFSPSNPGCCRGREL